MAVLFERDYSETCRDIRREKDCTVHWTLPPNTFITLCFLLLSFVSATHQVKRLHLVIIRDYLTCYVLHFGLTGAVHGMRAWMLLS